MSETTGRSGPELQEAKLGNKLLSLGHDVYAETSIYKGRAYASIRRWFQADDGKWYRTKNGLHVTVDDMVDVLAHLEELVKFFRLRELTPEDDDLRGEAEVVG